MKGKTQILLGVTVLLVVALACGGSSGGGGTSGGGSTTTQSPTESQVPENVPVPPGAYDIQVARSGTQVSYKVDGDIAPLVEFYQAELPGLGWTQECAPDSALGNTATMLRSNEIGEQLSVNMQYNQLGNFVAITMSLLPRGGMCG